MVQFIYLFSYLFTTSPLHEKGLATMQTQQYESNYVEDPKLVPRIWRSIRHAVEVSFNAV
jgi:hypothetical protein